MPNVPSNHAFRPSSRRCVAAFGTVDGAAHALAFLVENGFDERHLGIVPRHFHIDDDAARHARMAGAMKVGGLIGATAACLSVIAASTDAGAVVARLLVVALCGLVVGALAGALAGALRERSGPDPATVDPTIDLCAHRFEVVVDQRPDDAATVLAGWWDPTSPRL